MMAKLIIIFAAVGTALVAVTIQSRWIWLRAAGKGLLISFLTIGLMLAAGEIYFRYFHVDTEGRLASNNWMARYWHTNSQGFRDREWTPADWAGKTTIAVVGDSFTAGWGIDDPADRFADVLGRHLSSGSVVFNLGVPGASTPEELNTLRTTLDPSPDVVILQYFLNDIDYAALTLGLQGTLPNVPTIAQESYLANYIYSLTNSGFDQNYWVTEYAHYDNPAIWGEHEKELNAFIDYVDHLHARLIVVLFPNMQDPVSSIAYVDRVAQVFEERGYHDILKLFDQAATWSSQERVVSARDTHPSIAFHHLVGNMLYQQFFR